MPSVSKKQHNFMAAVANNPAFAKKTGIPQSVGAEFMKADKGLKFGKGPRTRPDLQKINKTETRHGKQDFFSKGGEMKKSKKMMGKELTFMKTKGAPKPMIKHEMIEAGMKYGGKVKKMAGGGLAAGYKAADGIVKKGKTKNMRVAMKRGGRC